MACDCPDLDFSASNIAKNGCPQRIPGDCLYYTGNFVPGINISSGDSLNTVVRKISAYLGIVVEDLDNLTNIIENTTTTSSTTTTTTTTGGGGGTGTSSIHDFVAFS